MEENSVRDGITESIICFGGKGGWDSVAVNEGNRVVGEEIRKYCYREGLKKQTVYPVVYV